MPEEQSTRCLIFNLCPDIICDAHGNENNFTTVWEVLHMEYKNSELKFGFLEYDLQGLHKAWQAAGIPACKPVSRPSPTLRAALHMIVRKGGFLGHKNNGEPGVKSR